MTRLPNAPGRFRDWLVQSLQMIYAGQQALLTNQEAIMTQQNDLQAALDRNTADTNAAAAAIQQEIQQLKDAVAALSTSQPPTQAQIDQLNASSDALEAATAALGADDTSTSTGGTAPA